MDDVVLSFQNVFFAYKDIPVLSNASFDIKEGEFIGIIGPNGGGKTTACQLALGFLKPQRGDISLFHASPKRSRHHVGYVPQYHTYDSLFPISVLDVVLTGSLSKLNWLGQLPQEEKRKGYALLEKLGLLHLQNASFGCLSGGEAQKTLLARALISDPQMLLLDEPTANIDPASEKQIFSFLREYKEKKTILLVTHNFDALLEHTRRILCFQNQVASLNPQDVCKHFTLGMYHPIK